MADKKVQLTLDQAKRAREHLIKARIYKYTAFAFMAMGLIVLFIVFDVMAQGSPLVLLKNPIMLLILILPFAPAYIFALLHKKNRKKAVTVLDNAAGDMNKKRTDLYSSDKMS